MPVRDEMLMEKNEVDVLSPQELLWRIKKIDTIYPVRDRAFVSFLYLTGARIEEVCFYILEIRKDIVKGEQMVVVDQRQYKGEPIKKSQVFKYGDDNNKVEVMNVRCLKRGDHKIKRNIPIYLNELEKPFYDYFEAFLKDLKDEDYLFPFTRQRANQILNRIDLFPHYLRHSRLSHLVTYYGFTDTELKQFTGWKTTREAATYVHLKTESLFRTLKDGYKR